VAGVVEGERGICGIFEVLFGSYQIIFVYLGYSSPTNRHLPANDLSWSQAEFQASRIIFILIFTKLLLTLRRRKIICCFKIIYPNK
jgi:hypothetical protein